MLEKLTIDKGVGKSIPSKVMTITNVTNTYLTGSRFALRQVATHTTQPPIVLMGLHLRTMETSRELQVLLDATPRTVEYEVECMLDPASALSYNSTCGIKLTGLTHGKDYHTHVRAVATGQNRGPWSDLTSAMVT